MKTINLPVHAIAHARAGDKGDVSNISLIAYLDNGWDTIYKLATKDKVFDIYRQVRAGSGLDPNRNLTRGSRVSRNPNRTGSFFGDPEVNRDDNFMNRATRGNIFTGGPRIGRSRIGRISL